MAIEERFSLRTSLLILVLACVVPLAVLSGVLLVRQDEQQRIQVEARTQLLADKVLADLEREMASVEAALRVLSTSRSLQTANLRAFHDEASRAVRSGVVSNYMLTDAEGRYRFLTLKPGAYPWGNHPNAWRPAHIHFSLFGEHFASRLVTQMYFPGDPLLALDPIYQSIREDARERLVSRFDIGVTEQGYALGYVFDIVLRGPLETPMETPR